SDRNGALQRPTGTNRDRPPVAPRFHAGTGTPTRVPIVAAGHARTWVTIARQALAAAGAPGPGMLNRRPARPFRPFPRRLTALPARALLLRADGRATRSLGRSPHARPSRECTC